MVGFFREAAAQDGVDARADIGPDFRPDLPGGAAEGGGMLDAEGWDVGVVAEKNEVAAPGHPHLVARSEHDAERGDEALWPG